MVENRPWLTFMSHAVLICGVLLVAFPLYITFVASTLTLEEILQVPMPLVPGYPPVGELRPGADRRHRAARCRGAGGRMMFNSLVMAL
jgi:sn-glycerol 3-phosphate transport system permease protein